MPEYLSPGVYVEEIDAGPTPIEGVSISTAGAVGVTAFGPTDGKPVLVNSFAEFVRQFGGYLPDPDVATQNTWGDPSAERGYWWRFPLSVKGFFDNGGRNLYVKRVYSGPKDGSAGATASAGKLGKGLVSEVVKDAPKGTNVVTLRHLIGIMETTPVAAFNAATATQIGAFTVRKYDPVTKQVILSGSLTDGLSASRGDFLEIHARSGTTVPDAEVSLTFSAKSLGKWSHQLLAVRVRPVVGRVLSVLADATIVPNPRFSAVVKSTSTTAGALPVTTVTVDSIANLANHDVVLVNGRKFTVDNVTAGASPTFTLTQALPTGVSWAAGTPVQRLRFANDSAAPTAKLGLTGAAGLYPNALIELDNGTKKEWFTVVSISGDIVTFSGPVGESYVEGDLARVIEAEVAVRYTPVGQPVVDEVFGSLRLVDDGSINFLPNFLKDRSVFVNAAIGTGGGFDASDLQKFPTAPLGNWLSLTGGDDSLATLDASDFVGEDRGSGNRTGISALEDIDQVAICMVPGMWAPSIQSALISHCAALHYRFAILDPPDYPNRDPSGQLLNKLQTFRGPINTRYAALYFPWLVVRDPSSQRDVHVPPSGHLAGIYARVDIERGPHKAPANEVVRGISGFVQDITKREQDLLNPEPTNINALRYFPGRGYLVWGARVLTSEADWKYLNVRRLFIMVEKSIDVGTQWVAFEPNDRTLWSRVRQTISIFLDGLWRNGMLFGAKASDAYFVRCDETTMSQDDLDNGRLVCVIGIAPVKPAEFVIFRIQQKTIDSAGS